MENENVIQWGWEKGNPSNMRSKEHQAFLIQEYNKNRPEKDLVYKIWLRNTDKSGTLTHTLRTMHRMPAGSVKNVGNPVYARNALSRYQLIYHPYVRRRKSPLRWISSQIGLSKIHETSEKTRQDQQNKVLSLW